MATTIKKDIKKDSNFESNFDLTGLSKESKNLLGDIVYLLKEKLKVPKRKFALIHGYFGQD